MHSTPPGCAFARSANLLCSARLLRRPAALLIVVVLGLLWLGEARAQTTSTNGGITFNAATDLERRESAYTQARPWWISRADCIANDVFTFSLRVTNADDPVEIWAGTDNCAETRNNPGNRGQCWIVAEDSGGDDQPVLTVPVRNVVARNLSADDPPVNLPASVCDQSDDRSGEQFAFYIMVVDGGQAVDSLLWDAPQQGGTGFDTLGPEPPQSISVGVGERQLAIGVDDVRENTDLQRFEAFCVPAGTLGAPPVVPSGTVSTNDAGVSTAGSASSTPAPDECFTPILAAGARPPDGFSCGVVSKDATTIQTEELANDTAYAVGVAGQDLLGNAGVVSEIQCGTPMELTDFYESYRESGGQGGGGFCNLSAAPAPGSRQPLAWLGALCAGLIWRRARSRR